MQELNNSNNQKLPPDAVPITTEDMLLAIGQLYIQVQTLQRMLRRQLESDTDGAVTQREIQNN
jgi:hypothetical protein